MKPGFSLHPTLHAKRNVFQIYRFRVVGKKVVVKAAGEARGSYDTTDGECLVTVTPCCWRDLRQQRGTLLTRFYSNTMAILTSIPSAKVTVRAGVPSSALVEVYVNHVFHAVSLPFAGAPTVLTRDFASTCRTTGRETAIVGGVMSEVPQRYGKARQHLMPRMTAMMAMTLAKADFGQACKHRTFLILPRGRGMRAACGGGVIVQ